MLERMRADAVVALLVGLMRKPRTTGRQEIGIRVWLQGVTGGSRFGALLLT
jgi:hypothetical protein